MPASAKALSQIPIRNIYFLLMYAWDMLEQTEESCVGEGGDSNWLNLAGRLLDSWFSVQSKRGLDLGYANHTDRLSGVRGRVEVGPTMRKQMLSMGQTICTFDELSIDTAANRVLKAATTLIAKDPSTDKTVREMMTRCLYRLRGVETVPLTETACRSVQTHSSNRSYRLPLAVAHLLAVNCFPDEHGHVTFAGFASDEGPSGIV